MEIRTAKVNFSAAGGTAGKGAKTCKVTLPGKWIAEMSIEDGRRELLLAFDGNQINLSRRLSCDEFKTQKLALGHDVRLFRYLDGETLCTSIYADFTDETLIAENHTNDPVVTAFGNNSLPTWEDFMFFLEERCIPRWRAGLREYLEVLELDGYDPLQITMKTGGRMAEDDQLVEMVTLL